jgi:uncharacterized membrane protein
MATSDDLKRWVSAGLIDGDVADAIEAFEAERSTESRMSRGIEAIAYLGASLVLVAVWVLIAQTWNDFGPLARFGLSAVILVVLFVVGVILGRSDDPAVSRAQAFAWFLTVGAAALTANVVIEDLLEVEGDASFFLVSLISLLTAAGLWWMLASSLQVVAMGVTAGITVAAAVTANESLPDWTYGVSFAALGALWLLLAWRGILRPRRTSYALGALGVLLISFPEGGELPWPLLGLAAGIALMALSVVLNESLLLGLGVVGLFIYIPMTVFELFGDSLGVPLGLLVTGLVLLGVVVVTARLRKETRKDE